MEKCRVFLHFIRLAYYSKAHQKVNDNGGNRGYFSFSHKKLWESPQDFPYFAVDISPVLIYIAVRFGKEVFTMGKTYFASYYYYFTASAL